MLGLQDRVGPRQTLDRMVAARFELPEAAINLRKSLRLKLEDVYGTAAEITEEK